MAVDDPALDFPRQKNPHGHKRDPGRTGRRQGRLLGSEQAEMIDGGGGDKLAQKHEEYGISDAELGRDPGD